MEKLGKLRDGVETLGAVWDRVEKWVIYGVLFAVCVLELLSLAVPDVGRWVDTRGAFILMSFVLIFVFRYLDARIRRRDPLTVCEGRQQELIDALREKQKWDKVDLFTHTSSVYVRGFLDSGATAKEVRILLRDFQELDQVRFPHAVQDKEVIQSQSKRAVADWTRLQQEGKIESLEIKYYQYEPMGHFIILDKRSLCCGLYTWEGDHPGVGSRKHEAYIADGKTVTGRAMIDDFQLRFDELWT